MIRNGNSPRPIQFWISVIAIGGLVVVTLILMLGVLGLAMFGKEGQAESNTLNNAALLAIGGLVSLAGSVGGWLYGRGAQGEPISPPTVRMTTTPVSGSEVQATTTEVAHE